MQQIFNSLIIPLDLALALALSLALDLALDLSLALDLALDLTLAAFFPIDVVAIEIVLGILITVVLARL